MPFCLSPSPLGGYPDGNEVRHEAALSRLQCSLLARERPTSHANSSLSAGGTHHASCRRISQGTGRDAAHLD